MLPLSRPARAGLADFNRPRDAWTAFWNDPTQSRCVAGSLEIGQALSRHWAGFAKRLLPEARVLDLGCGAGAVARALLTARPDIHLTGIDFARVPLTFFAQVELLSDTAMESLPFADQSFAAVVSQFGFEYGEFGQTAKELARVIAPGGLLSMIVHHAGSSIVDANGSRLRALDAILAKPVRAAFCRGECETFQGLMSSLAVAFPHDPLVVELSRSLPSRLLRAERERIAIWNAIADALAPERCLAESLQACCVESAALDGWLEPLRQYFELEPVSVVREPEGQPIAWRIQGTSSQAVAVAPL